MKLCMIRPFANSIEHLWMAESLLKLSIHFFFPFYRRYEQTVVTKPALTQDLFHVKTSAGAFWKGNALQNLCTSIRFPIDGITSPFRENEHQFWDNPYTY